MSPQAPADDHDLILQDDDPSTVLAQEAPPWRILIVDDDVDVHVVTKFALRDTTFQGRRLSFLHAYSGKEAIALLQSTPDIALVLLDVIMETNDAGLRVARAIREDLHNELVRIVLRTGQPGQALEHSIIVDYDINDFWSKADLTTRKLFTTVIASLRAYSTLAAAAAAREELKARLSRAQNVQAVLDQHALVVTLDGAGRIIEANERFGALAGAPPAALAGRPLHELHSGEFPQAQADAIAAALAREGGWAGDIHVTDLQGRPLDLRCAVVAFKSQDGTPHQYVAMATMLEPGD